MRPYILIAPKGWAMPSARALAYGQATLRCLGGSAAAIAIAGFCTLYFAWEFTR